MSRQLHNPWLAYIEGQPSVNNLLPISTGDLVYLLEMIMGSMQNQHHAKDTDDKGQKLGYTNRENRTPRGNIY